MLQSLSRSLSKYLPSIKVESNSSKHILLPTYDLSSVKIPNRTTFILRRKHPVPLIKKNIDPKIWIPMKKRHRVYELEKYTENVPEGEIQVLLTKLVPGIGEKGDVVTVKRSYAYNKLLLLGLAEYATPEAIEEASERAKRSIETDEERFSSIHVHRTMNVLRSLIVRVVMNQENSWVLEPWHIRASFRKAGVHVLSDNNIEMPKQKIQGPDLNIDGKEFLVTVTINNKEKVQVRCRIHHWHSDIMKRIPTVPFFWTKPAEPLFKEEADLLSSMPLPPIPKNAIST